jgi:hypothetical protein
MKTKFLGFYFVWVNEITKYEEVKSQELIFLIYNLIMQTLYDGLG